MKERLMVHLRTFPQIVETWMRSEDNDAQPSQFARAVTKVLNVYSANAACVTRDVQCF